MLIEPAAHLGDSSFEFLIGDPHEISRNGKILLNMINRQKLTVFNSTQQIPEQKIYWKIFYHKFTDQVDHKFMENLTKNI